MLPRRLPVVFHDRDLERLTAETGPLALRDAAELCAIPLRASTDRILSLAGAPGARRRARAACASRSRALGAETAL